MKILYVSAMSSSAVINSIHRKSKRNPGFAMQKFHRLIATGFSQNGVKVKTLSGIPGLRDEVGLFCARKKDVENGVEFNYIPFISLPGLRHLAFFLGSFFYVLLWGVRNKRNKRLVFDVLNISVCLGGLLASKLCRIKSCGIVTDMPGLMVGESKSFKQRIISGINKSYLKSFDTYVFLTRAMNEVLNVKSKPFIVMEGLVDSSENTDSFAPTNANKNSSIIYAGGLFERYGIKMLIEAFTKLDNADVTLDLYGHGPMVDAIKEYQKKDHRIIYHGIVANDVIVSEEKKALLLVNPRPTNEEFVKFSFPSKNMEYMVSGTAVLTTKLPGMPDDYLPYVFCFEEESVEGFHRKLNELLSLPLAELTDKGISGRNYVLKEKNNIKQSGRIMNLIFK